MQEIDMEALGDAQDGFAALNQALALQDAAERHVGL